jgi:hypothetical protein
VSLALISSRPRTIPANSRIASSAAAARASIARPYLPGMPGQRPAQPAVRPASVRERGGKRSSSDEDPSCRYARRAHARRPRDGRDCGPLRRPAAGRVLRSPR